MIHAAVCFGFVLGVLFTSLIARADTRWKSVWYEELRVTVEALFYVEKYYVDTLISRVWCRPLFVLVLRL